MIFFFFLPLYENEEMRRLCSVVTLGPPPRPTPSLFLFFLSGIFSGMTGRRAKMFSHFPLPWFRRLSGGGRESDDLFFFFFFFFSFSPFVKEKDMGSFSLFFSFLGPPLPGIKDKTGKPYFLFPLSFFPPYMSPLFEKDWSVCFFTCSFFYESPDSPFFPSPSPLESGWPQKKGGIQRGWKASFFPLSLKASFPFFRQGFFFFVFLFFSYFFPPLPLPPISPPFVETGRFPSFPSFYLPSLPSHKNRENKEKGRLLPLFFPCPPEQKERKQNILLVPHRPSTPGGKVGSEPDAGGETFFFLPPFPLPFWLLSIFE